MRATIPLRVALAKWASVSFTGRPTARATIASASLRLISRPPPKGSTTTSPPSTGAVTTKCAGRPTPSIASPTRRPTSIVTTESVSGTPRRRVRTSFRKVLRGSKYSSPLPRKPSSSKRKARSRSNARRPLSAPAPERSARSSSLASQGSGWRSGYSMRATASAARPRSICPSGRRRRSPNSPSGSAARGVMDPRRRERRALQLLRELERASRRPRRGGLRLGRRREAQEERAAELVVVALVRLDHVAVQRRGLRVAGRLAEPDELAVLDDRDRLARELAGRHALHGGRELVEVLEERAPALGQRVERPRVPSERAEALRDHPIVLGLVANLPGERELHVHRVGRHEPAGRDLGGLELVPERDPRSEEHTSELQSPCNLVCRLLLEKKKTVLRHCKVEV